MKRVLNSGYIKLLEYTNCTTFFKFEMRFPILLLNSLQESNLGTLKLFPLSDVNEVYLPPFFYKSDASGLTPMSPKDCNVLNTKYSNFYRNVLNFYNNLLELGVGEEQARLVLPLGLFVTCEWEIDFVSLTEFIEKNYYKSAELTGFCSTLVLYLEEHTPKLLEEIRKTIWKDLRI